MRSHKFIILAITAIFFGGGFIAGCIVDFDADQEGLFSCKADNDCLDGYVCDLTQNVCMERSLKPDEAPDCVDEDGDGYGTNEDRRKCQFPELDCDDTNPNVHPNHPEICDGIYNGCDPNGIPDNFVCPGGNSTECGRSPHSDVRYTCVSGQCILQSTRTISSDLCASIAATCNSAEKSFVYEADGEVFHLTGDDGNLNGPIEDC